MAQQVNAVGVMDPQSRTMPSVFTPGVNQEAVIMGGPQITDKNTGIVYSALGAQTIDAAGVNAAAVDAQGSQNVSVGGKS